jgi:hypothetical protein
MCLKSELPMHRTPRERLGSGSNATGAGSVILVVSFGEGACRGFNWTYSQVVSTIKDIEIAVRKLSREGQRTSRWTEQPLAWVFAGKFRAPDYGTRTR